MNLIKRILGTESRELKKISSKLDKIREELVSIRNNNNRVQALVDLTILNWVFKSYEFELSTNKMVDQKDNFIDLCKEMNSFGASDNRAKNGERPNSSDIFLGDIYGLWTFSASEWLSKKTQHEKDLHSSATLRGTNKHASVWQIINDQARQQLNLEGIDVAILLIDRIKFVI